MTEFNHPDDALRELAQNLAVTDIEPSAPLTGRVLAEAVHADRDSPAIDVSAMDGYAIRLQDLRLPKVPVTGEAQPGQPPVKLIEGTACRIFTGAAVPVGAEAVVMREDTDESAREFVSWRARAQQTTSGANIRFQGENGKSGDLILSPGTLLSAANIAAAANFGASHVSLHRCVRVTIIVTGNELLDASVTPEPWQLRDSNGPTIAGVCAAHRWIECKPPTRCEDNATRLSTMLQTALDDSDAIILTGGVSKGDYDHVPGVIESLGAKTIFHRLPIRPGRPILGAVSTKGQLILGLPGNPVSAAVGMVRFGIPLLSKQSGNSSWIPNPRTVTVTGLTEKLLPLHWYRLVKANGSDSAELLDSRGSGDLVALSHSTGFIHQPPNTTGPGPWEYFEW